MEHKDVDISRETKLAVSVIVRALKDYHARPSIKAGKERIRELNGLREDAAAFLSGKGGYLSFWCIIANINPAAVSSKFRSIDYRSLPKA